MKPISLGIKGGYPDGPCCVEKSPSDTTFYPSLHIDRVEDLSLPDEGTITLRYKLCRDTTEHPKDDKGEKTKSYALDVLEVVNVDGEMADKEESPEAALDKLRSELEDKE